MKPPSKLRDRRLARLQAQQTAAATPVVERIIEMPEKKPVTVSGIVGDEITVNVVQGIGDIFWVYQQLAPYFKTINFSVYVTKANDVVQMRSLSWLPIYPQTGSVTTKLVDNECYRRCAHNFYHVQDVIDAYLRGAREVEHSTNTWLERGVRLDEIDPGAAIQDDVDMQVVPPSFSIGDYLALFVSGSTHKAGLVTNKKYGIWTCEQWADFVELFFSKMERRLPIILIGASFDAEVMAEMYSLLKPRNPKVYSLVDRSPAVITGVLKHSSYFIGYQSGLNILADNLGTKQLMVYFNYLRPMLNTWCRRENIGTRFHAACFEDNPAALIDAAVKVWSFETDFRDD